MRTVALSLVIIGQVLAGWGSGIEDATRQFISGSYTGSIAAIERELKDGAGGDERQVLLSRALLAVGRYPDALRAMTNALEQEPRSIPLRWQAREVFLSNGQKEGAREIVDEVVQRVAGDPRQYRDAATLVVFGQAALMKGADPKKVLDQLFEMARKADPKLRDVYLAAGNLALEKHDFALAAKKFEDGLKQLPNDPDMHYGLARAYAPSDPALMLASAEAALERNSNHVGALLLLAEYHIDAEQYDDAEALLKRIEVINPWRPEAWAYRAVLAHLDNQPAQEEAARNAALKFAPANPKPEHLIGLKLSQKYRFAEGAAHQRQALQFEPDYVPAKAQLAQDLLRLGEEAEGWKLAMEVQKQDGYDVQAFNLANLHDAMAKFTALTNAEFVLRMGAHEAAIYGPRALDLLSRALTNLCAKYGMELKRPTIVEIFPEQKDFAVRTFGMPGNPGYLGVCFGSVVTANSPAVGHGHPVNWEAVLWHEFCHVVTLQMTRNKMPRWLSEGISVYEETQANPSWGQRMTPTYREMILGDELTAISKLSGAFLTPQSEMHLQFAYYESSLVVEFLVNKYGLESLKAILRDLGQGTEINAAIASHTVTMEKLEAEFETFARERAEKLAPGLDFEKPEFAKEARAQSRGRGERNSRGSASVADTDEAWDEWGKGRPTNFWVMSREGERLVDDKHWAEATNLLTRLLGLFPDFVGPDSAYSMLAKVYRNTGETNAEREVLARWAQKDDEAADAYLRLMELAAAAQDWPAVALNAQRYLSVNPLVSPPHRYLAQACEHTGDIEGGITAYRALLELEPPDPAEAHFRLAKLLYRKHDPGARRHVLQALEEAPRYREALRLLLEINSPPPQTSVQGGGAK